METPSEDSGNLGHESNGERVRRRRIPKACALCRTSKLRCDGGKPCTRCRTSNVQCDYMKPLRDPVTEKLELLEQQMHALTNRVSVQPDTSTAVALLQLQQQQQQQQQQSQVQLIRNDNERMMSPSSYAGSEFQAPPVASPVSLHSSTQGVQGLRSEYSFPGGSSGGFEPRSILNPVVSHAGVKRKRGDFEVRSEASLDIVGKGLVTYEDAVVYFDAFFQGCDKYVPVFDPQYDTFDSVRARSGILFDTICTIGCRAELGPVSSQFQSLSNATKGPICDVILGTIPASIETIQALLVDACYSEKGWLLTSMAVRMALDLDLPKAYNDLCSSMLLDDGSTNERDRENEAALFRRARVWFGTFILEHILSLDCGKKPGVEATDGMRRCRVLLKHPARTSLDLRLLAQVELNSIRAAAHERLTPPRGAPLSDDELSEIVQGTRIDLSIWLSDWINLVETHTKVEERASLIVNMRIQRDWAEMTMLCKGLQGIGIDNVAIMSEEQQKVIHLAKASAQRHLTIIISNPDVYLATFRYGMDFVWAKCAFSVLLLLKLARLLASSTDMPALISDAKTLLSQLSKTRGPNNIYFRILCLTVEKCERALKEANGGEMQFPDAEMEFQSYVPKEFILEWSFPGLTFCWIPFDFQDMFLDFGAAF